MNYANGQEVKNIIKRALKEDIGRGDITTRNIIPKDIKIKAVIIAKEKGIVCGMDIVKAVFKLSDNRIRFLPLVKDKEKVEKGEVLAKLNGLASSILSSERVALNFLGFLSGIATRTQEFVKRVESYNLKILDTRKTIPGLRKLEKYAVEAGGGLNHRLSLDEMVLIKDNHLKVVNSCLSASQKDVIFNLIKDIRKKVSHHIKIEIEVKNLKEFKEALEAKPDIIMLDNMSVQEIKKAIRLKKQQSSHKGGYPLPKLEASGNINLKNIGKYAVLGIDFISLGILTKDIKSLDVSLEVK